MIDNFKGAISFLTIFKIKVENFDAKKVLPFFPVIGLLIGSCVWVVGQVLPSLAPIVMLICSVVITGGLHLDGLADMSDAYFSGKEREKMLEIMKDSRLGTMGVLSLIVVLLVKFYCFEKIYFSWILVTLPFAYARGSMLFMIQRLEYVRENGTGKLFFTKLESKTFWPFFVICLIPLVKGGIFFIVYNFVYFLLITFFLNYHKKKLGGATGDILGATSELIETALLMVGVYFV